MKNCLYTRWGKTLLFLCCMALVCGSVLFGLGTIVAVEENFGSELDEVLSRQLYREFFSRGYDIFYQIQEHEEVPAVLEEPEFLSFSLQDAQGKELAVSRDPMTGTVHQIQLLARHVDDRLQIEFFYLEGQDDRAVYGTDWESYTFQFALKEGYAETAEFALQEQLIRLLWTWQRWLLPLTVLSLTLCLGCFVLLLWAAGRRKGEEGLYPGPLVKLPLDLLLAAAALLVCLLVLLMIYCSYAEDLATRLIAVGLLCLVLLVLALWLCMNLAVRIKGKNFLKNTLIYRMLGWLWRFLCRCGKGCIRVLGCLPLIWRSAVLVFCVLAAQLLAFVLCWWETDVLLVFWFLGNALLVPAIFYLAYSLRRLQKGGEALAAGNLQYHTDTRGLIWDLKRHGENLNSIALGMNTAVEQRLKSERMKTELITNVSHDIKTPLTSIINYAGLIAAEPCENEKITEYSQVLTRQSQRLKRLIDDLVEASKASTGNLEVTLAPCDAGVFLSQAAGEYEQRLADAGLQLILRQSPEPLRIQADGRRMWRIFDNLMNNILKYALPGTRVYLGLEKMGNQAVITFKNTSRQALELREEDLLERFVRGDAARHTEGSGLGLSIARSLTQLQGGELRLFLDGDLFKAMLIFPILKET